MVVIHVGNGVLITIGIENRYQFKELNENRYQFKELNENMISSDKINPK